MGSGAASHVLDRKGLAAIRRRVGPLLHGPQSDIVAKGSKRRLLVCSSGSCASGNPSEVVAALRSEVRAAGLAARVRVVAVGCIGLCEDGPLVIVDPDGVCYAGVGPKLARPLVAEHLVSGRVLAATELCRLSATGRRLTSRDIPFFSLQHRIVLRNCGVVDPLDVEDYIALDGYRALEKVLFELDSREVLEIVAEAGLRDRGGEGLPTSSSWLRVREATGHGKYVVCAAQTGDPGSAIDRSLLEGDPHTVIEAMAIAGRVIGAGRGCISVPAEHELAIERLGSALAEARRRGLLGARILGSDFDFEVEIRVSASAIVSSEDTALLQSIEGRRGMPRPRPPEVATRGLWNQPTLVTSLETLGNVPQVIVNGPQWFAATGTPVSRGTKVIALAGSVRNTGLIEVPMGTSLRRIVVEMGGGTRTPGSFKGVHLGGPLGKIVPASEADIEIDHDALQLLGPTMGSGAVVVLDDSTCMVDFARRILGFLADESCGKCPSCRIGTVVMLNILELMTRGEADPEGLETLTKLARHVQTTALCGLGQNAPNTVLSGISHFREEYEAHVRDKGCPARHCVALLSYSIHRELCDGCGRCVEACSSGAISGSSGEAHTIDMERCTRCGECLTACPAEAVVGR